MFRPSQAVSVLAWNVNGLHDSKLLLWDTCTYLDIVLLCETRCLSLPAGVLPDHSVALVPAQSPGRAGEGLILAVRKSLNLRVQDWASDATSLCVKLVFPDDHTPLLVGICYLPPAGSHQLTAISLADRLAALEADLLSACSAGDVILAGDFNARVGALDDSPDADHPLPPRGATDITVTQSGQLLVDICRRSGVALGTGRIPGDEVVCPTFRARRHTQATGPDHVVFKSATLTKLVGLLPLR